MVDRIPSSGGLASASPTLRCVPFASEEHWSGMADIVSREELARHAAAAGSERQRQQQAADVLTRAQATADSIVRQARNKARLLGESQLERWQAAYDAHEAEITRSLGDAVATVVEAVLREVLGSHDELPVRTSLELAMRVLSTELRAAVLCHPLDLAAVQAHESSSDKTAVAPDASLPRGQLIFTSAEGDVRVDGQRVFDRLAADLRQLFSARAGRAQT